jgi:hypothetical protein
VAPVRSGDRPDPEDDRTDPAAVPVLTSVVYVPLADPGPGGEDGPDPGSPSADAADRVVADPPPIGVGLGAAAATGSGAGVAEVMVEDLPAGEPGAGAESEDLVEVGAPGGADAGGDAGAEPGEGGGGGAGTAPHQSGVEPVADGDNGAGGPDRKDATGDDGEGEQEPEADGVVDDEGAGAGAADAAGEIVSDTGTRLDARLGVPRATVEAADGEDPPAVSHPKQTEEVTLVELVPTAGVPPEPADETTTSDDAEEPGTADPDSTVVTDPAAGRLPTMADLDWLKVQLDEIDATLARMDARSSHQQPATD